MNEKKILLTSFKVKTSKPTTPEPKCSRIEFFLQFFHQFRSAFVGRHPSKSLAAWAHGAPPDVAPPEHAPHHQADHPPVAVRRRAGADPLGKSRPARARAGGRHRYAPRAPQCRRRAQRHVLGVPRGRAGRTRLARRLPSPDGRRAADGRRSPPPPPPPPRLGCAPRGDATGPPYIPPPSRVGRRVPELGRRGAARTPPPPPPPSPPAHRPSLTERR